MTVQLSESEVKGMTPEQIDEAHRKGQLRDYLSGSTTAPVPAEGQLGDQHLAGMSPEEIDAAHVAGRLDQLLGIHRT
ncbi:hypothetical protein OHV05_10135 [Kitasatospora sp. NBC_00070]|uniref:hypothetical protein n=1 Tax=Kitasatospora sp. NBC_00070 TaxID=2975962 RepID=UPI00324B497C